MKTVLLILLLGPFLPRRVAQRTHTAGATTIWILHGLGLLLGAGMTTWTWWYAETTPRWAGAPPAASPHPGATIIVALVSAALGFVVSWIAALIALPFAWRDEALRDTWRYAVRTVRLFTPAWMLPTVGCGAVLVLLSNTRIVQPSDVYLMLPMLTVLPLWAFAIVARAVSADRPVRRIDHEPVCEVCGYLLHHVPSSQRCPECGTDIVPALDPTFRWFPSAENSTRAHRGNVFDAPSVAAWIRPSAFLCRVRLDQPVAPLLGRAAVWFTGAAFAGWICFCMGALMMSPGFPAEGVYVVGWMVSAMVAGLFGLWCLGAGVVGLLASAQTGRNLLRAAFIVAAHTSGFYVVWVLACVGSALMMILLTDIGWLRNPFWGMIGWLTVNIGMALYYVLAVWRRMRYVRYGNWQFTNRRDSPRRGVRQ